MRPLGQVDLWTPEASDDEPAPAADRPRERPLGAVTSWSEAERGSGTVLVIGFGAILIVGGLLAVALATIVAATHRADAAADLAALSAARLLSDSADDACAQARAVAAANTAELVTCRTTAETVDVVVRARTGQVLGSTLTVQARARAGPSTITDERQRATQRADRTRARPPG